MSIDTTREKLLSLAEATHYIPATKDRRLIVSTIWRWCRQGVKGVRLEYVRVGRKMCTSHEAMSRFFAALAEADQNPTSSKSPPCRVRRERTPKERVRAINEAEASLEEAGI